MRDFQKLDPTSLKAFYYSALELNFTRAAKSAGLTQSGISQHIKRLEHELGTKLFTRHQKEMRLNDPARELLRFIESYLDSIEGLFDRLQKQGTSLKGKVRYAMPDSCLFTPHFGQLLNKRMANYPNIELSVKICDSEEVLERLLNGEIDFGFITKNLVDKNIESKEFAREEYVLVGKNKKDLKIEHSAELKRLAFIQYPGMEELYNQWFQSEFSREKKILFRELNFAGEINSIRGALTMVENGLGMGIFQKQCVTDGLGRKVIFAHAPKNACPQNPIYLIHLKDQKQPARVRAIIDAFWGMKN